MMKRIYILMSGIILLSLFVACGSTYKQVPVVLYTDGSGAVYAKISENGELVTEESESPKSESETGAESKPKQPAKTRKPQTKAAKKGGTKESRMRELQTVDPYTGWIYIPEEHFTITNGDIRIDLDGRTGTYCIYAVNEKSSTIPLLSIYDSFSSSFFSVLYGNRMIELKRMNGIKTEARRTPYGGQLVYTVPKKVKVIIDFTFLPSIASSSRVDMLRVTAYVVNIGSTTEMISLKSIFDTILGEDTIHHFSTREDALITSEVQYTNFQKHKWVRSTNGDVSVQFIFEGEGLRSPTFVTLANKATIEKTRWLPSIVDHKSFNSAVNYNNSEIAVNWDGFYLDPKQMDSLAFYISVAINGDIPAGDEFIEALSQGTVALGPDQIIRLQQSATAPEPVQLSEQEVVSRYWENMPPLVDSSNNYWNPKTMTFENTPVNAASSDGPLPEYSGETGKSGKTGTSASRSGKKPSTDQIDMAYVQALIEHIELLENSDEVDEAELKYLNDELDAIMGKLEGVN